jgi:AraC-like DNA-binding protein
MNSREGVRVFRHESPLMRWELVFAVPPPALRCYVREYVGWFEQAATPICRRELPSGDIPLIINFGARVRECSAQDPGRWTGHGTFTAGLYESFSLVETDGPGYGLQVNFTALGARLFFARPLEDFANRIVDLEDVFGPSANCLTMELYDAGTWDARFTILDREIGSRIAAARGPSSPVAWAWRQLIETRGAARIGDLVHEIGWSEKHFIAQFRHHIGLPPKTFARVLRFGHAVRALKTGGQVRLADVAYQCGYYDQAHFARDFRAFAGVTPTELLDSRLPDEGGFSGR